MMEKLGLNFTEFEIIKEDLIVFNDDIEKQRKSKGEKYILGIYNGKKVITTQEHLFKGGIYYQMVKLITQDKNDFVYRLQDRVKRDEYLDIDNIEISLAKCKCGDCQATFYILTKLILDELRVPCKSCKTKLSIIS